MKRRDFLGSVGVAAGSLVLSNSANAKDPPQRTEFAKGPIDRPLDIKLAVKPVYSPIIHTDVCLGPCRPSVGERPKSAKTENMIDVAAWWSLAYGRTPEQERADAETGVKEFAKELRENLGPDMQLLDPVLLEYSEDFWIHPERLARLEPDKDVSRKGRSYWLHRLQQRHPDRLFAGSPFKSS